MKRFGLYLFFFIYLIQSSLFAYSSNPKDFINELVNEAISKLSDKNLNQEQKAAFIKEVALENVDINALGLYTLGELRKSSNEQDISKYKYHLKNIFKSNFKTRRLLSE